MSDLDVKEILAPIKSADMMGSRYGGSKGEEGGWYRCFEVGVSKWGNRSKRRKRFHCSNDGKRQVREVLW